MNEQTPRPHSPGDLAGKVEELARRMAALEARLTPGDPSQATAPGHPGRPAAPVEPGEPGEPGGRTTEADELPETYWALNRLRREMVELGEDLGGVLLTGSVRGHPEGVPAEWQAFASVSSLLEADLPQLAESLGALGQPVRLKLLYAVLEGRATVAGLVELDGLGTTGQIYHHLRQLVAAGWLQNAGRGRYEVPPGRMVPLLTALAAARR